MYLYNANIWDVSLDLYYCFLVDSVCMYPIFIAKSIMYEYNQNPATKNTPLLTNFRVTYLLIYM